MWLWLWDDDDDSIRQYRCGGMILFGGLWHHDDCGGCHRMIQRYDPTTRNKWIVMIRRNRNVWEMVQQQQHGSSFSFSSRWWWSNEICFYCRIIYYYNIYIYIYIERERERENIVVVLDWCCVCVCDRVLLAPNGGLLALLFIVVTFGCFDMRHTHSLEMTQMCTTIGKIVPSSPLCSREYEYYP